MATSTSIPVTIDPEAAEHIAAWGLEQPYRQMIEHARRTIPGLRRIEVEYSEKVDEPDDRTVVLYLMVVPPEHPVDLDRPIRRDLVDWFLRKFPGAIARHFLLEVLGDDE